MNKNNINNNETLVEQLIHQKTKTIRMEIPYIRLLVFFSFIFAWIMISSIWFFWLFWLLIWSMVLRSHVKKRMKKAEYKKRIEGLYSAEEFRIELKKKSSILSNEQIDLLILGYVDFLKISLMSPIFTQVPSKAIDDFWDLLIERPSTQYLIGFKLTRRSKSKIEYEHEGYQQMDEKRQFMERNVTWQMACQLNGLDPLKTNQFPRLYLIDQALEWDSARTHDIDVLKQEYALYKKHYRHYEELEYSIIREIPHLGIVANFPVDDST